MPTTFCADPIATVEQFKKALLKIRDKNELADSDLVMLKAQCKAPNATITSTQLADAAKFHNYNAANLRYGTLAFNIAKALDFTPKKRLDSSHYWWTTLSYSIEDSYEPDTEHFQFIMRPELVEALLSLGWVRHLPQPDATL